MAEQDASILQLIPYVVLVAPDLKVFSYQRRSGGESRLDGKHSIGVGGHVNISDLKIKTVNKKGQMVISWDTVVNGAVREVVEELELDEDYVRENLRMVGTVYTPNSSDNEQSKPGPTVGQVHLGIIYTLPLTSKAVVVREEDQMINYKFVNRPADLQKYERWSQLVLQKIDEIREILAK
jgi:predicted NUDIX family phosphoesterase